MVESFLGEVEAVDEDLQHSQVVQNMKAAEERRDFELAGLVKKVLLVAEARPLVDDYSRREELEAEVVSGA